ncbi:DUF4197 domain-containing protein [Phaeodactylibacter luteus]|uniref:DUF4197 domain-containing protein n=1 Tax=Phaeodactylibacter luteus TaxID=1564516 RepID=A0A5C6S0Z9_9BACT|nr:DUF4197 domain-containing protein [Phaeodactylibacter luteus]TXB67679.1 DUF4197 domain-containing protein [Phaeodactylibacter luteus]
MQLKWIFALTLSLLALAPSFGQAWKDKLKSAKDGLLGTDTPLSAEDAAAGLREALTLGASEASGFLSAEDGFLKSQYKIELPDDVRDIARRLRAVPGFQNLEEELTIRMNRAAELAAQKAQPIFTDAIRQMSFQDAMDILTGQDNAATQYLYGTTYQGLYDGFKPVIINALDEVNARAYWKSAVVAYNKLPLVQKANPELDDYVTSRSLEGLFALVEVKEKDIRENASARTSDLLKRVFAKQRQ